jgi:PilZ domain
VSWGVRTAQVVSRVRDLNEGGMFVSTPNPEPVGTVIAILLVAPEGQIRGHGTVRNTVPQEGMGVEITAMGAEDSSRFRELLKRLLARQTTVVPQDLE